MIKSILQWLGLMDEHKTLSLYHSTKNHISTFYIRNLNGFILKDKTIKIVAGHLSMETTYDTEREARQVYLQFCNCLDKNRSRQYD